MLEKVTASIAADQGLLLAGDGGSGGNGKGGAPGASDSIMNALQESNQQLGASMNEMYEKQCSLERQRLEIDELNDAGQPAAKSADGQPHVYVGSKAAHGTATSVE
jgi:hypothetical protein